ncbi:MAG TPA: UpxY family transcription antiterminator [Terriglobales bacterium]
MQEPIHPYINLSSYSTTNNQEWFAVQTKPRHEKKVASELKEKQIDVFLPLLTTIRQWSDRKQEVAMPLFPTYMFVRMNQTREERTAVLSTNGVHRFVGMRGIGVAVPDDEIESVQKILVEGVNFADYPFLAIGQKVRVRGGSLDGVSGILTAINNDRSLIVSVQCIQRSLAVRIEGYGVEPA